MARASRAGQSFFERPDVRRIRRYSLAEEALNLIEAEDARRPSIDNLASRLGISSRLLEYVFNAWCGVAPSQYILAARLTRVRRALNTSEPERTVTQVASAAEFHHFGRFSSQYRRFCGETPSMTLRRARRRCADAA
ncbi:MAG: AraC family transcriptional regulator [Rhodospirillales bacterium]|nr:AraC family transcriptional regulator [Rhodospirillales bacterium]